MRDQRLVLERMVRIDELAATERFGAVTPDVVDAVIVGVTQFAGGEWAPLATAGDTVGARWTPDGVVMPAVYADAYRP